MSTTHTAIPPQDLGSGVGGVGLGSGIAIAVGLLILISTIMLASYVCVRIKSSINHSTGNFPAMNSLDFSGVYDVGLAESVIDSYPKFIFSSSSIESDKGPCPICLSEYKNGELLRCVPECKHCFHAFCLDQWLRKNTTCPLCRNSPVPSTATTPVATPLSEFIPLAFHAR